MRERANLVVQLGQILSLRALSHTVMFYIFLNTHSSAAVMLYVVVKVYSTGYSEQECVERLIEHEAQPSAASRHIPSSLYPVEYEFRRVF